jgi:hypothetical protein
MEHFIGTTFFTKIGEKPRNVLIFLNADFSQALKLSKMSLGKAAQARSLWFSREHGDSILVFEMIAAWGTSRSPPF